MPVKFSTWQCASYLRKKPVHQILAETHDQVRSLRTEYRPRFLPMVEKARADIAAALTPEQRAKFDKILKEKERLWNPKVGSVE